MRRRQLLMAAAAVLAVGVGIAAVRAAQVPAEKITVYKTSTCGCCSLWVKHLQANGFEVEAHDIDQQKLTGIAREAGVTADLQSCHTAKVGRYVVGNGEHPTAVLADIDQEKAFVADLAQERQGSEARSRAWRSRYTGAVLTVGLSYLYAGKQAEGWNFILNTYDLDDRDVLIANLRYYLLRCPIFRSVYKDVQEILRSSMQTNE